MEFKNFLRNSSNNTYNQNNDLLEEHGLLNILGSPNRLFLKFLKTKNFDIHEQEITEELIEEFKSSKESVDLEYSKIQRRKQFIFNRRKVWINIPVDDDFIGSDLILDHDSVTIEETGEKIAYADIIDIEIEDGGWSKNSITIITPDDEIAFEINEDNSIALKEILEKNMSNTTRSEIDDLLELYDLYEAGEITEDEFERRKGFIYSDDVYCTECGEKLDSDSEFCSACGHKVG